MVKRAVRALFVSPHVTQNPRPFEILADAPGLEILVAYGGDTRSIRAEGEEYLNRDVFDRPMLDGYPSVFPRNIAPRPSLDRPTGLIQPGLVRLVAKSDVVVVYGHAFVSCWIAICAALVLRKPIVLTTDATELGRRRGSTGEKLKGLVLRFLYSRVAARVFVPSSRSRNFLLSLGVPASRVVLTPYCVDETYLRQRAQFESRDQTRAALGIPADARVLLVVSKLISRKRAGDVLQAIAADSAQTHVIIAGDGPLRGELERRASALGIRERAHFLGFVSYSRLPSLYTASDLLVHPADKEPFGLAVLEALLLEVPVVASDAVGSADDLVEEGRNGFIYPAGDTALLRRSIHAALRLKCFHAAPAVGRFTSEQNAAIVAEELKDLAAQTPPFPARLVRLLGRVWPFERGRTRLRNWYQSAMTGRADLVRSSLRGSRIELDVPWQDMEGGALAVFGEQDPAVYRFLQAAIGMLPEQERRRSLFLDIGSCYGMHALRIAERYGCSVYAFEPHRMLANLLERNVRRNGLSGLVSVFDIALGARTGEAYMFQSRENAANSKVIPDTDGVPVRIDRLDNLVSPEDWRRVAIAKIDVEGFEVEVLRGAEKLLGSWRPTLILEMNMEELRQRELTVRDVLKYLLSIGYGEPLVIDRLLHPLRTGMRTVSNIVVPGENGSRFVGSFPYVAEFRPVGTPHCPVVIQPGI